MLKKYTVHDKHQLINEDNLFLNLDLSSFTEARDFLLTKSMMKKKTIVFTFKKFPYINDVFDDDKIKKEFESFVFDLLEHRNSSRFVYITFKLKEQSMDEVIHSGLYEWLEFWMLFFKFTHVNIILELEDENLKVNSPISYQIAKRLGNPRLSLFINSNEWNQYKTSLPEDLNTFVILVKDESMINSDDLQYATMFLN